MKNTTILITVLVAALIIVSLVLALDKLNLNIGNNEKTINVAGESSITAMPDKAEVMIRIESTSTSADTAKTNNQATSNKVIDSLKRIGISSSDIETQYYDLRKNQVWEKDQLVDKGYIAEHVLKVSTKDLDKAGLIVDEAVEAGATGVDQVSYTLTKEKEEQIKREALAKATTSAREKAETIATSLGTKITGIKTVSESNVNVMPYYARAEIGIAKDSADFGVQLQPKSLEITAYINVVYNIK